MKHYVQYHNREKARPSTAEAGQEERFYILTRKNLRPENIIGQMIWLFAGEGKSPNKRFYLVERFIAKQISPSTHPDYRYEISGDRGRSFEAEDVTNQVWFQVLKRSVGNFSLGLSEIKDPAILNVLIKTYT